MNESNTSKTLPFQTGLKKATAFAKGWASTTPLLIAVDGHSATGKSTFAKRLARALPQSTLVHTDDFYRVMDEAERFALEAKGGYDWYYNWQRLRSEILEPLSKGHKHVYRPYDWRRNTLGEWQRLEPSRVVIVEGCYAARPELKDYYGLIILVETSEQLRSKRQAKRADASVDWLERWAAAECYYFRYHQPQQYAHLLVNGEP
jgi:uridine kinase